MCVIVFRSAFFCAVVRSSGLFYYIVAIFFWLVCSECARLLLQSMLFLQCFLYRICDCDSEALLAYVIHLCRNVDTAFCDLLSYFNAINEKQ